MQKRFLITILYIFAALMAGKSQKVKTFSVTFKAVLTDSIRYSNIKPSQYFYKNEEKDFCIFKDNAEIPMPFLKTNKAKNVKYSGLTKGDYVVCYENIFAQTVYKPFTITDKNIKNLPFVIDTFIDTVKMSFFEEMKNGDTLGIFFNESWHEGGTCDSISIVKNNDSLSAKIYKFSDQDYASIVNEKGVLTEHWLSRNERGKTIIKEKRLNSNDIALMKDLFKRLTRLCETGEHSSLGFPERTYYININGKLIHRLLNDHSEWNSMSLIKYEIFGIKPNWWDAKFRLINH